MQRFADQLVDHARPIVLRGVDVVDAVRDDEGGWIPAQRPEQLRAGVEDNLAALGVDRLAAVNLRLMDGSAPGARFDAQLAALVEARDEGLIDGVGLSNISKEHLLRATAQTDIVCVQNLFNLADQRSREVLDECSARGIAFVPYFPLGWPRGAGNAILTHPVLAEVGARLGGTPAQVALAWLLDLAPNILLIPGTRTRRHLAENNDAATLRLDDGARADLARHFPAVTVRA